jgi:protein involved in sex pheromone biosynthesis
MLKSSFRLALLAATLLLSACTPLLVGGAVAVVADEVVEQETGGDGLF